MAIESNLVVVAACPCNRTCLCCFCDITLGAGVKDLLIAVRSCFITMLATFL